MSFTQLQCPYCLEQMQAIPYNGPKFIKTKFVCHQPTHQVQYYNSNIWIIACQDYEIARNFNYTSIVVKNVNINDVPCINFKSAVDFANKYIKLLAFS